MGCAIGLYDDGMIGGGAPGLADLKTLIRPKSACFDWNSGQLAEHGMIEEGRRF